MALWVRQKVRPLPAIAMSTLVCLCAMPGCFVDEIWLKVVYGCVDRLTEESRQAVLGVLTCPKIGKNRAGECSQIQCLVQFPVGKQAGIARYLRDMEFQLQGVVEADP